MTATKELMAEAITIIERAWNSNTPTGKKVLDILREARRKLPTQAAVDRDRKRHRAVKK